MKILAFSDMHGDLKSLNKLEDKLKDADLVVCGGDFTIFENHIEKLMEIFGKFNKDFLIIHGNHESEQAISYFCKNSTNLVFLHDNYFVKDDVLFLGWGGGGFNDVSKEFEKNMDKFKAIINAHKDKAAVLVTHAPPYYTAVDEISGVHCGNKSISNFVLENDIDLVLCGHLHENENKHDKLGKSIVVNPGRDGTIVEI